MENSLKEKLEFLYKDQAGEIYEKLQQILSDFQKEFQSPPKQTPKFSEKDAVLICYADHVQEPNSKTFPTMHKFLNQYVKGVLPKVHFLPFYPYSSDDGFSVIDYYQVKEEFGTWDDVKAIARDFELMYDFVCNHISQHSEWFQKFLDGDPKYLNFFIAFDNEVDVSQVFRPRTNPLLTPYETKIGKKYVWTTFSADQIDVNFDNPGVLLEMIKVFMFYIKNGAKLIRMDAVHMMGKELGTNCVDLPKTHQIVKIFREVTNRVAPNVWLISEQNRPHLANISYFGNGKDEAELVYNFALPPLLLHSFINGDVTELAKWAKTIKNPSEHATYFNYCASHDGIAVGALYELLPEEEINKIILHCREFGGKINYRTLEGGGQRPYEINIVYYDAMGRDVNRFLASQAAMLSLVGVPGIYFNSLFGTQNWEEGVEKLGYNRAINRQKYQYADLTKELDDENTTNHKVYTAYKKMLQVRLNEPLFSPLAEQEILDIDSKVFAVQRSKDGKKLLALINVSSEEVQINANHVSSFNNDILSGEAVDSSKDLTLKPYQVMWLK